MAAAERPRILVVGGGYVGMYTALRLQHRLRRDEATITIVDPQCYMTYQPFLPESAAGNLEPRHVVVPLRTVLRKCNVLAGRITTVDHNRRVAQFQPAEGESRELPYDVLVMAPGSIARTLPIPGLAEVGIGFKSVAEAIYLRNRVLAMLDLAAATDDLRIRRRALSFVFIGAGYAGIEAIAELQDLARYATRYFDGISPGDMRWLMVEATSRVLPEVSPQLADYTVRQLAQAGIEVRCDTKVTSLTDGTVELSDGDRFEAKTVVWTAGVRPNPLLQATDLPLDDKHRLPCHADLRVRDVDDVWSAGDCAAVPDLTKDDPNATCGPTAQHAVRQAKRLADNILASLRGQPLRDYKHAYAGSVASLGLHRGVAEVYGVKLRGWPAWFMHRTYHLMRVPTTNRKCRVAADWTLALFFRREIVSLGSFANPRREFEHAVAGEEEHPGA